MNDNLYCVEKNVSLYDLMQEPKANQAIKLEDKEELEEVLEQIGFDLSLGWEFSEPINHRPRTMKNNHTWTGPMVLGYERQDKEWLKSGFASEEAIIEYCPDPHLRAHLKTIGKQVNYTGALIDEMKKHAKHKTA